MSLKTRVASVCLNVSRWAAHVAFKLTDDHPPVAPAKEPAGEIIGGVVVTNEARELLAPPPMPRKPPPKKDPLIGSVEHRILVARKK